MNNDIGLGLVIGILIGAIFTAIMISFTASRGIGFGLGCADKVLNNPEMVIDTTYTIHQGDTTAVYSFVKKQ